MFESTSFMTAGFMIAETAGVYGAGEQASTDKQAAKETGRKSKNKASNDTEPETVALNLALSLSPKARARAIRRALRGVDISYRELAHHLYHMAEGRQFSVFGYTSMESYAYRVLNLGESKLKRLVVAGRELPGLAKIDEAFCAGKINWSRVRELVRFVTAETEDEWLELAVKLSWSEFCEAVTGRKKGDRPGGSGKGLRQQKTQYKAWLSTTERQLMDRAVERLAVVSEGGLDLAQGIIALATLALQAPAELVKSSCGSGMAGCTDAERKDLDPKLFQVVLHSRDGKVTVETATGQEEVPGTVVPRLDAEVVNLQDIYGGDNEIYMPHGEKDIPTPTSLRNRVITRDGSRCKCCGSKKRLHAHHIVWRCRGGRTIAINLTTVCERCHSLIHDGLIMVEGRADETLRFLDSDGVPLDAPRPDDTVVVEIEPDPGPESVPAGTDFDRENSSELGLREPDCDPVESVRDFPTEVAGDWWERHQNLLRWNVSQGIFQLRPGTPRHPVNPGRAQTPTPISVPAEQPQSLDAVIGQKPTCQRLRTALCAASKRGVPLDHLLLEGAPGLGKTSIAQALAAEAGTRCHNVSAATVRDGGVLLGHLAALSAGDVLFLDEIHALPDGVATSLYDALAVGKLTFSVSDGAATRAFTLDLPPFTLIGATSETDQVAPALRSRFTRRERLTPYSEEELAQVVTCAAKREAVAITSGGAATIAAASRGNARDALSLYRRCRDETLGKDHTSLSTEVVQAVLKDEQVDTQGLRPEERKILEALHATSSPIGITRLAALTGLDRNQILKVHEPWLVTKGLVCVTDRGRRLA